MNQEQIGKFIASKRKDKKLTQNELANRLGITNKAISKWENGHSLPDYSLIKPLCEELGITINELLSGENIPKEETQSKNENIIIQTLEYFTKKESKNRFHFFLALLIILILLSSIICNFIKKEYDSKYMTRLNIKIMYEKSLDEIKENMDMITETNETGEWLKLKELTITDEEYEGTLNTLVSDIQYCYSIYTENQTFVTQANPLKDYFDKEQVTKDELDYLNSKKEKSSCLTRFDKYQIAKISENAEKKENILSPLKHIHKLEKTELFTKNYLTYTELNNRALYEVTAISSLSKHLWTEYFNLKVANE